ncbi:MAG: hypothetical protein FWD80_05390 [Propionibacteriaceae bacterium]|nr:hypothetical protein [Propionibacteriaceae bacterium]
MNRHLAWSVVMATIAVVAVLLGLILTARTVLSVGDAPLWSVPPLPSSSR